MLSRLSVLTAPAQLPVDVNFARQHLRSAQNTDDNLLMLYMATAVEQAEAYLNKTLITTTYAWNMSETYPSMVGMSPLTVVPLAIAFNAIGAWAKLIEIPRGPIQSVTSVAMGNWGQADSPLVLGTDYDLDLVQNPPRLRLARNLNYADYTHTTVVYTAGYGPNGDFVPPSIVHAVLLLTASLYERRGDEEMAIPSGFFRLLDAHRLKNFSAA